MTTPPKSRPLPPARNWQALEGSPYPLGVRYIDTEQAYNFALYSKDATGVVLHLFIDSDAQDPSYSKRFDARINKSARTWHCRLPAALVDAAAYYAYTVEGPFDPNNGLRFDPDKLLLDPYARGVHFPPGHCREAAQQPGPNTGLAPLGVLLHPHFRDSEFDWGDDPRPHHTHDAIIYEMHIRGFTIGRDSGVPEARRGTFSGVIDKIPYLLELGVTIVELLPVFQFDPEEENYWGYMSLNFFAPHHLYAASPKPCAAIDEFRQMVRALHQAGIEVVLDVVYNHSTESDELGPTYSFRGIDNRSYYLLEQDRSRYRNDAGTGNVLNTANRYVRAMVLDSLRYWVTEMHVDGFRFDLASIFTRRADGSVDLEDPPMIAAIRDDPALARVRLIAEAWDISSYQLGRDFPGISWQQWNGRFRDDLRRFIKGDQRMVSALMTRLYGSDDLFPDTLEDAYHAFQSVNFITAHDGFTLYDLVAYDRKHNLANGNDNTDGSDNNHSWNHGYEGHDGAPAEIVELRQRQVRNLFCLLMLANGTPMFVAGDEFLNSQQGNNNPYNQDNQTSWLDWQDRQRHADVWRFFRLMIAFRKQHPSLSRSRFWRNDLRWFGAQGAPDLTSNSHTLAFYLDGRSQQDDDLYVMINAWWQPLEFRVQRGNAGDWLRAVDTGLASPEDIVEMGEEQPLHSDRYPLQPRSIVVLRRPRR